MTYVRINLKISQSWNLRDYAPKLKDLQGIVEILSLGNKSELHLSKDETDFKHGIEGLNTDQINGTKGLTEFIQNQAERTSK